MQDEKIKIAIIPNVLIVDDNINNIFAMKNLLEHMPIKLYEARSGNEALKLLTQEDFALVLLDVQMPEIDGFETAELMRKNKHTKEIPIIFVTALSKEEQYIRKGLQVGAVDYLLKPLDPIILESKVSVFINYYIQKKQMEKLVAQLSESKKILATENANLDNLAHIDALTGLENKLTFEESLELTVQDATRHKKIFFLMFLDLDNFKTVNDTLGHDCGDLLLKEVAERFKKGLRSTDLVLTRSKQCSISRLGGDEFAILLPEIKDPNVVIVLAKRIIDFLNEPFILNGNKAEIGVSIGIAAFPEAGNTIESLKKSADIAMYHAKKAGKNNYQIFHKTHHTTTQRE